MKENGALLVEVTKRQKMKEIICLGKSPIVHQYNHKCHKICTYMGLKKLIIMSQTSD